MVSDTPDWDAELRNIQFSKDNRGPAYAFSAKSDVLHLIEERVPCEGGLVMANAMCGLYFPEPNDFGDEIHPVSDLDDFVDSGRFHLCPNLKLCKNCEAAYDKRYRL